VKYFDLPIHRGRMEWLCRLVLIVLAFDIWTNFMGRAGRYGFRDFNVSHFVWLDAVQPMPSPALYAGGLLLASVAAIFAGFFWRTPWILATVTVGWTWAWASSLLDSYQHHYFLSLVLVCFFGFPMRGDSKRSWGFPLLCVSTAVMYFFAAFAKTQEEWRDGTALRSVVGAKASEVQGIFADLGIEAATGWEMASLGVVLVQVFIGIAYLLAPLKRGKGHHILCAAALFSACSFHGGAEWMELKIGWFSYYMIALAVFTFTPDAVWEFAWERVAKPVWARWCLIAARVPAEYRAPFCLLLLLVASVFVVYADLPGVLGVSILMAVVVILAMINDATRAIHFAAGALLAGSLMWFTFGQNESRYNYYRYTGGDASRVVPLVSDVELKRELLETAIISYEKANQYAPEGQSREKQLQNVRQQYLSLPSPEGK